MTCEIAVMNKAGVALAADSAVTIGDGQKIYHHVQKLFQLSPTTPVGILISGVAEIMSMPWEVVVKSYASQLGQRRFDHLEDYALDFFAFIESSTTMFSAGVQREWFTSLVKSYWDRQFAANLGLKSARGSRPDLKVILPQLLRRERSAWRKETEEAANFLSFSSPSGGEVLEEYGSLLAPLERRVFGDAARRPDVRSGSRATVQNMYDKHWFHPNDQSWVAFAGLGECDSFPAVHEYLVGSLAIGRLRWAKTKGAEITRETSACVLPLAQSSTIDMFFRGIDPSLQEELEAILPRCLSAEQHLRFGATRRKRLTDAKKIFRHELNKRITRNFEQPLMDSIDSMPQHGLTMVAEMMVNLTAFRKRISMDEKETVGGATNIAFLSKGEGFVWVKRPA